MVKGFKAFNYNWTCWGKQYTCPGIFTEEGDPCLFKHGMHFCKELPDCFVCYPLSQDTHIAEVIAWGKLMEWEKPFWEYQGELIKYKGASTCCTNELEIVREVSWNEILVIMLAAKKIFPASEFKSE